MSPTFAIHWARELGANPNTLERMHGGINNQVLRCGDGAQKWVIKGFSSVKPGRPDRMKAELQFLQYANQVAPGFTPVLVCSDLNRRCLILEHIEGKAFTESKPPTEEAIAEAVCFIDLLNRDRRQGIKLIEQEAAEGFLSLRQHVANVHERIQLMNCRHIEDQIRSKAELLLEHIRVEMDMVEARINRLIGLGLISDSIDLSQCCISPGDFGFHNAIITPSGVRFIDFEFAGWDDPAKTTLDFSLQPRVPLLGRGLPLLMAWPKEVRKSVNIRCQQMAPILRIKWLCILLSVLNEKRLHEILSVIPEQKKETLICSRLERAQAYLESRNAAIL